MKGLIEKKAKKAFKKAMPYFYKVYCWGFDDAKEGKEKKTAQEVEASMMRGFEQGLKERKN